MGVRRCKGRLKEEALDQISGPEPGPKGQERQKTAAPRYRCSTLARMKAPSPLGSFATMSVLV